MIITKYFTTLSHEIGVKRTGILTQYTTILSNKELYDHEEQGLTQNMFEYYQVATNWPYIAVPRILFNEPVCNICCEFYGFEALVKFYLWNIADSYVCVYG